MSDYYSAAPGDAKDQILQLAARPEGMHSSELPDFSPSYLTSRCHLLVKDGLLFRARVHSRNVRFFTTKEAAEAAELAAQAKRDAYSTINGPTVRVMGFSKDAKVVYTERTKYTQCPAYKPRFQAIDTGFVHTALQSGRVVNQLHLDASTMDQAMQRSHEGQPA